MKKGIYYLPLFIILLFIIFGSFYVENYLSLFMGTTSFLLLCEVYYLRFIK